MASFDKLPDKIRCSLHDTSEKASSFDIVNKSYEGLRKENRAILREKRSHKKKKKQWSGAEDPQETSQDESELE